jgi:hypothetical protein
LGKQSWEILFSSSSNPEKMAIAACHAESQWTSEVCRPPQLVSDGLTVQQVICFGHVSIWIFATYDVVRLLEGAVPAVLKEPDPLPTAKANGLWLSYSKCFIFSLATSKTVSETRSLWCSCTLNKGCGLLSIGITS